MLKILLAHAVQFALTLLLAAAAIFLLLDILPGDPAKVMLGLHATPEALAALHADLGLDQPAFARFSHWLIGLAHGDMGTSIAYRTPVATLIAERLDVTVPLALLSFALTLLFGIGLGFYAALHARRAGDFVLRSFAELALSIPNFWVGQLLILGFAVTLGLFPSGGFPGWSAGWWNGIRTLLLPALALSLTQIAILLRLTRAALLDVLSEPYIRTARAKGLSRAQTLWRHALRNASLPIVTILGLQLSFLLTGVVIVENVFALPGIGRLMLQAVNQHDLVLVQNLILIFVAVILVVNFFIDTLMLAIDPRLGTKIEAAA